MADNQTCEAQGWTRDDGEVTCDLPAGHLGLHADIWEGWEWPSPRKPPALTEEADAASCPCGCPDPAHIGEIGCPCGLPDEPPCSGFARPRPIESDGAQ